MKRRCEAIDLSPKCRADPRGYLAAAATKQAGLARTIAKYAQMIRHVGRLYRLSDADIDEVMQGVRIRLWRAIAKFGQVSTSYVYRASMSAAIDILRQRRVRGADWTVPLEDAEESMADATDPSCFVEESELATQVGQAIEAITPSRRPAVMMYLLGYTREEVAAARGWSEAKTRNLLYRGLSDLKERLTDMGISSRTAA